MAPSVDLISYFPLHCWNEDLLRVTGKTLGNYIDKYKPKFGMFICSRICVEVDLKKGIP
jgi:hypothetical protein